MDGAVPEEGAREGGDLEDSKEATHDGDPRGIGDGPNEDQMPRLSAFEDKERFSGVNPKLKIIDELVTEISYGSILIRRYWGMDEFLIIGTAFLGYLLGSWDIGVGELSSGGDYNRWGFFGEESGFLNTSEMTLILSFLSILCWLAFVGQIWIKYPIMRENLAYLLIGSIFVQLGFIRAHANSPLFPFSSGVTDWVWVIVANFVMLFLAIVVVCRAVIETRDVHVRIAHSHPDPRILERQWRDHSLMAWGFGVGGWVALVNVNSWIASHSIAPSPGQLDFSYFLVLLNLLTGVVSSALLLFLIWFPQLMLGGSKQRIMSSRAREVEGVSEIVEALESGTCPVCNHVTRTTRSLEGVMQAPCTKEGCNGKGTPGEKCEECGTPIPTRLVCEKCKANTPIVTHFGESDAW